MSTKELRELDAWIAEHVMGWLFNRHGIPFSPHPDDKWQAETVVPRYTTDPAAAMAVLEKCAENLDRHKDGNLLTISVRGGNGKWRVGSMTSYCDAKTLPLAIALFAKKLFSK